MPPQRKKRIPAAQPLAVEVVEEATAAAETMTEQTRRLLDSVGVFKVDQNGKNEPAQPPARRANAAARSVKLD
jgi:hypothetical protein